FHIHRHSPNSCHSSIFTIIKFASPSTFYSFITIPCPRKSTLFPYTTLFRSLSTFAANVSSVTTTVFFPAMKYLPRLSVGRSLGRSEEHTSELQSHLNLVCRLLLEKK